jgi:hypothetical protein
MDERKISFKLWVRKSKFLGDASVGNRHVIGKAFPNQHQEACHARRIEAGRSSGSSMDLPGEHVAQAVIQFDPFVAEKSRSPSSLLT